MKFLFVDQLSLYPEMDAYLPPPAPNLGAACLAGACREAGIPMSYYDLLGRFLHIALRECHEEICGMLNQGKGISETDWLFSKLQELGEEQFAVFLADCHEFCTHPTSAEFTSCERVLELSLVLKSVLSLYALHLSHSVDRPHLIQKICREIEGHGADVIGFSVHTAGNVIVNEIIRFCKERSSARFIAGGQLTFHMGDHEIDNYFFDYLGMDAVVRGYADSILPKLLESDFSEPELSRIPNIFFRIKGRVLSGPRENMFSFETLPRLDFSIFELDRYFFPERLLPIQTARGCYWKKCAFCRRDVSLGGYREFSPIMIAEQLHELSLKWDTLYFCINNECLHPRHAKDLSKALLGMRRESPLMLMSGCRPDNAFDTRTLGLMAGAGFRTIFWGIESGCDRHLQRIGKGTSVASNERILSDAFNAGISNLCFFIIGFPGETEEDAAQTIAFIKRNHKHIDFFRLNPFVLYDDTPAFTNASSFGLKDIMKSPDGNGYEYSVTDGLSRQQAPAIVAAVYDAWRDHPDRFTSARYENMASTGFGDEMMSFYFWQHCRQSD